MIWHGGIKSSDPDKKAAFAASLEFGYHDTLGTELYADAHQPDERAVAWFEAVKEAMAWMM